MKKGRHKDGPFTKTRMMPLFCRNRWIGEQCTYIEATPLQTLHELVIKVAYDGSGDRLVGQLHEEPHQLHGKQAAVSGHAQIVVSACKRGKRGKRCARWNGPRLIYNAAGASGG